MVTLVKKDYLAILHFYNIDSSGMKLAELRDVSNDILANKLCRCIKKIDTANEASSIAICKNSILTKKGLTAGKFKCKKGALFISNRMTGRALSKLNMTRKRSTGPVNKFKG